MRDIKEDPQTSTYPYPLGYVTRDSETGSSSITVLPDPSPSDHAVEFTFIVTSPVTIARNCETGAKFPDRISAVQFMLPSAEGGVFELIDPIVGYGWVDLDIGLKPNERKLISEWN